MKDIPPWRKRVLFFAELPAFGYQVFTLGYQPEAEAAPEIPSAEHTWLKDDQIGNGFYTVSAKCGQSEVIIKQQDKVIPLKLELYHDVTGSWGDMSEKPENSHYPDLAEVWQITRVRPVEAGPLRSRLWVEISGKKSRIELVFSLVSGQQQLDISARISWLDRAKRLKLQLPKGEYVDYDVPGGIMRRGESASVPGGRYAKVNSDPGYVFYSDTVYGFEHEYGCFSAVLARGCRFSTDEPCGEDEHLEHPVADHGELLMNFIISPFDAPAERIAENLEQPPIVWLEASHSGAARNGALARALPEALKVIDMSSSGMILQNRSNQTVNWLDQDFPPWKIIRIPVSGIKTDSGLTF